MYDVNKLLNIGFKYNHDKSYLFMSIKDPKNPKIYATVFFEKGKFEFLGHNKMIDKLKKILEEKLK